MERLILWVSIGSDCEFSSLNFTDQGPEEPGKRRNHSIKRISMPFSVLLITRARYISGYDFEKQGPQSICILSPLCGLPLDTRRIVKATSSD